MFLFLFDRKLFYLSLIIIYPIVGQLISYKYEIFNFSINPSMVFGLLVLAMTSLDFVINPSQNPALEIATIVFILYALTTSILSPVRFESLSWALKLATWLMILLSCIKLFSHEGDLIRIHIFSSIAVLIVIFSFTLSWLGFYGESLTYESGVESYAGGFHSGKTPAYYLAIAIPIMALKDIKNEKFIFSISFLLITICFIVMTLTFVRAPIVALFIGFLAYQYFNYKYNEKSIILSVSILGAIFLLVLIIHYYLGDTQYFSRWDALGNRYQQGEVDKLGSGRVGMLMNFFDYYFYKASLINKLFGSGLGSSMVYLGNNLIIHNDFAEILMGCGIIGFSLYLFILLKLFVILVNQIKNSPDAHHRTYGILAQGSFFIFLSLHMTNVTSGIFVLSLWAIHTGATIGIGQRVNPDLQPRNMQQI